MAETRPTAHPQLPPAAVWHTAGTPADDGLTVHEALLLLGVYTSRNATIVDFDADPALALAARARTRHHHPIRTRGDAHLPDAVSGTVELVHFTWPRPTGHAPADTADLLGAAADLLGIDGRVSARIAPHAGKPGGAEPDQLRDTARGAGLVCCQRIIIVDAADGTDRFTYHLGDDELDALLDPRTDRSLRQELLIYRRQEPTGPNTAQARGDAHTPPPATAAAPHTPTGGSR